MKTQTWLLLLGLNAAAGAAEAPVLEWLPGRLSLRFLEAPTIARHDGLLDLGPAFLEVLAELPEARIEALYPSLRRSTIPDLSLSYVLTVDPTRDMLAVADRFLSTGLVEYAEPDWLLPLRRTPNDPLLNSQWALAKVDCGEAWDLLDDPAPPPAVIAIIDTGVQWTHPDLLQRIWVNPGEDLDGDREVSQDGEPGDPDDRNGLDDDGNSKADDFHGWDYVAATHCAVGEDCADPDNNPMDFMGHGTWCAGVAAAHTDNSIGVASLAWETRVMALRAGYLHEDYNGRLISTAAANAIYYAIEHGAQIISMSFGGSATLRTPATVAWNEGLLCFHSAGSEFEDQLDRAQGMVSVAATDSLDCTSVCGDWIDLAAPGVDIMTLEIDGYAWRSGSSLACPMAANLAALIWSQHPELDNLAVRERLLATADPISGWACNQDCTAIPGRINARRALENDTGLRTAPPSRPVRARLRAHPNPFNPASQVNFTLPAAGQACLAAYNLAGQRVALLLEGRLSAGEHAARFNGAELPSGLYVLRLELDGRLADQGKALLLK